MCGRYALALRPSQVRRMLEELEMAVYDAPEDDGDDSPRQSYNFAPGYHGIVYRAPSEQETEAGGSSTDDAGVGKGSIKYKLQSMKWGLIPAWTKRNPDYGSMLKTINCRDDSLSTPGGMWSTMKARKRCIVIVEGFYEWLKKGPKERVPHYVKRKDGQLMLFCGLWDCVRYENSDEKHYTYSIITTDSNKQLSFLHDRMPVILEAGSEKLKTWLDPKRREWSKGLQDLLKPFEGELEIYQVTQEVNKVGHNSSSFTIPLKDNKSNIVNFFANASSNKPSKVIGAKVNPELETDKKPNFIRSKNGVESSQPSLFATAQTHTKAGVKRGASEDCGEDEPPKKLSNKLSPKKISATSNGKKNPSKSKQDGSQKITKFFANSA